ncbi:MAG: DEAD/DEAH box helicase family protein [Pseudonocardia sp.]|nr:DEAD/DEAH box helicase family protein [Pseudonocardia sp.]
MNDPYAEPVSRRPSPAPLVDELRREVDAWRRQSYTGASVTTKRLFEHWFLDEHEISPGEPFRYYFAQREAIETIVYLYEVAQARDLATLAARYADRPVPIADEWYPRYVVKMATGAGKTKVMSLAVAWSYFHAIREVDSPLPTTSLLIAPNLIVYERLREDFEAGAIFRRDPVIPPEWRADFDLEVCLKGDAVPTGARGVLALTNVQALYERPPEVAANPLVALLGPRPTSSLHESEPLLRQIAARGRVLVVNDEAHHLHDQVRAGTDEPLVAVQTLRRLHDMTAGGLAAQLDFSATPKDQRGRLFPEVVSDYPLAQAIEDGIVKRPIIGELGGAPEAVSGDASVRYRQRLAAGVAKWREFRDLWKPTGRNPLMFVMAEDTRSADEIARYLDTLTDLAGRVLVLHVNLTGSAKGEIRRADLDLARRAAREVDRDDSPYSVIVSVLMLREGWDVRNVTVVVPLRALTAKAQILPEQTLGRGLRRMTPPGSGYDERVVVIEHEAFRGLWDTALETDELDGVERTALDRVDVGATVVTVEPDRMAYDIDIPRLPRVLARTTTGLDSLTVADVPARELRLPAELRSASIDYTGRDLLSGAVVERAEYPVPFADDPNTVLAWYVNEMQREAGLTGQFAILAPLVRDWVEQRAFGGRVDLADPLVLHQLSELQVRETVLGVFRQVLTNATVSARSTAAGEVKEIPLSATRPFLWSGATTIAHRTVFSALPCDSDLEVRFSAFLDRADDVAAFAKLGREVRFSLEYRGENGRLAYYYPDFVARLGDGRHLVLETKGRRDDDVPRKDERARRWALDATAMTPTPWAYQRIDEDLFDTYATTAKNLMELVAVVEARRRAVILRELPKAQRRTREELVALMDRTTAKSVGTIGIDEALRELRESTRDS